MFRLRFVVSNLKYVHRSGILSAILSQLAVEIRAEVNVQL